MPKKNLGLVAIILNEAIPSSEFDAAKNCYNWHKKRLKEEGFQVKEYSISNSVEIIGLLNNIEPKKLGFLWIRGHGEPKKIKLSEQLIITPENINSIFKALPEKLSNQGVIYLSSCNTGNIDNDFYNNMQFSFGKLTQ